MAKIHEMKARVLEAIARGHKIDLEITNEMWKGERTISAEQKRSKPWIL